MTPRHYVPVRTRATVFVEPVDRGFIGSTAAGDAFGRTIQETVSRAASRCLHVSPEQIAVTHDFSNVWVGSIRRSPRRDSLGWVVLGMFAGTVAALLVIAAIAGGAR